MNKAFNSYYTLFAILICTLDFRSACAKDPVGAYFNYKGKYTSDIKNYEVVVPQRVNEDGNFISHVVSHQYSKRSTKEMDLIFYKIPIAGKEYLIELSLNKKLISPGAVVETYKVNAGNPNSSKDFPNSTEENVGQMFKNLSMRKLKNNECHFSGHVKGENISKAALSTCYGLAGFIHIEKGFYTIEPVAEHDPFLEDAFPHILYKSIGLENNSVCQILGKWTEGLTDQMVRKRRESNIGSTTPRYIETLIVMDKSLINYHKESDCENYVLTVFNMAFNLFHDASLGLMMTLTIVRIIRLEIEDVKMNLNVTADAEKTLQYFQNWQYEINPGDDSHPNHHDVAILITRVDVCYSPSSCGLLGLSTIGKACDPKLSAALCEDTGLRLGFVIAHEIGHLLGADHDTINSTCNGTDAMGLKTIMHPQVSLNSQSWSKCSQAHIKTFSSGMGKCLLDEPEDHHFNVQDLLPGVMYNADFQCKHLISTNARECEISGSCLSLNCYVPGYACIITHFPPADGTSCGESMWCHDGKCIVLGQRPGAVDGNWGEWSSWSECTRTCGSGVSSSVRQCDKPLPSHGGKNCVGERKRYKVCATTPCKSGRPSFRDVQCGEFDDWIYPEDGKTHIWKAYYLHDDNPCILYCINEEKKVAALRPRVVDGTMCYRGIRDICIGGTCKTLPCDLHFESNAIEDACGVCHGDGTGCEFSSGTETLTKSSKVLTKLITVPSGSRNIRVEEMAATVAKIIVKDKDTKDVYVNGNTLGMHNVPGSQAWLGMIRKNQEALNIPGPINKPLSIWIKRLDNVTVKWSMALPPASQRKPDFTWNYMKWSPCSAKCGPGTQKSEPSCMEEKAGLVESTFCADLEMPPVKVRPCEITKCKSRWMVGDWRGCKKPTSETNIRKRVVYCIRAMGEGEGESQIVPDSECPEPKPHDKEPCENRQKREDAEYNHSSPDYSMFRSDTVEFGFHKKYDDYLTHFAALSVPQRKSETVPLHLLSSPHFKHYFRVLETPEDYSSEVAANGSFDVNFFTSKIPDHENKVSPDFYKNTFSGNPIDVSHVQSQHISNKVRKNIQTRRAKFFDSIQENKRIKKPKLYFTSLKKRNEENQSHQLSKIKRGAYEILLTKNPSKSIQNLSFQKMNDKKCRNENLCNTKKCEVYVYKPKRTLISRKRLKHRCKCTKKRNCWPSCKQRFHKFLKKKQINNFNFTSPNLTHLINSLEKMDLNKRNLYAKFLRSGDTQKKFRCELIKNNDCSCNTPNSESIMNELSNSQSLFSKGGNKFQSSSYCNYGDDLKSNELKNFKKLGGSGVKKLNYSRKNFSYKATKNDLKKQFLQERKNRFSNSFDPMASNHKNTFTISRKFDNRYRNLEDFFSERHNKKIKPRTLKKRNMHFIVLNTGSDKVVIYKCISPPYDSRRSHQRRKINKRLSRRWKKQKSKDSGIKSNKEPSGNGYGAETRNYLNNLFRDTHAKVTKQELKQHQKQEAEKTVIDTGRLVIDRDPVDTQQIEIMLEDDGEEEPNQEYRMLPRPSQSQKKLILSGQQVFDLYQKLQDRNNYKAYSAANLDEEPDTDEKIEINVKIPSRTKDKSRSRTSFTTPQKFSATTKSPKEATLKKGSNEKLSREKSTTKFVSSTTVPPRIFQSTSTARGLQTTTSTVGFQSTAQSSKSSTIATSVVSTQSSFTATSPTSTQSSSRTTLSIFKRPLLRKTTSPISTQGSSRTTTSISTQSLSPTTTSFISTQGSSPTTTSSIYKGPFKSRKTTSPISTQGSSRITTSAIYKHSSSPLTTSSGSTKSSSPLAKSLTPSSSIATSSVSTQPTTFISTSSSPVQPSSLTATSLSSPKFSTPTTTSTFTSQNQTPTTEITSPLTEYPSTTTPLPESTPEESEECPYDVREMISKPFKLSDTTTTEEAKKKNFKSM